MKKTIVAFGEIMLRLAPPDKKLIKKTDTFCASYGGSESNVLVALSALGNDTRFVSAVPDNPLGEAAIGHLRSYNTNTSFVRRSGDNLGMYFVEEGFGDRASGVIYARKNSAITQLSKEDINFDAIFAGCDLFHISGISFALSTSVRDLCFALLREARERKIRISFDFNYRARLWTYEEAGKVFRDVMPYCNVVFCSERDLRTFLGVGEAEYFAKYPHTSHLVIRERETLSVDVHRVTAKICTPSGASSAPQEKEFPVLERVGGGDAFAAGVLHALLKNPADLDKAAAFGVACLVLKHTVKGDVLSMREGEICKYMDNVLGDIAR